MNHCFSNWYISIIIIPCLHTIRTWQPCYFRLASVQHEILLSDQVAIYYIEIQVDRHAADIPNIHLNAASVLQLYHIILTRGDRGCLSTWRPHPVHCTGKNINTQFYTASSREGIIWNCRCITISQIILSSMISAVWPKQLFPSNL